MSINLDQFRKTYRQLLEKSDAGLDSISNLLDEFDSEGDRLSAARAAFVQAQLAIADLARKLDAVTDDDLDDELADRDEDEDEDEEDETESA